jgi:hypothetical protein
MSRIFSPEYGDTEESSEAPFDVTDALVTEDAELARAALYSVFIARRLLFYGNYSYVEALWQRQTA